MQSQPPLEYEDLPVSVKQFMSGHEWAWLSDAEKARLIRSETEPEAFDD